MTTSPAGSILCVALAAALLMPAEARQDLPESEWADAYMPVLDYSVRASGDFDPSDPVVIVVYSNLSDRCPVPVVLPTNDLERQLFTPAASFDGTNAVSLVPEDRPDYLPSHHVEIPPLRTLEHRYRLGDRQQIPKDWSRLGVFMSVNLSLHSSEWQFDRAGTLLGWSDYSVESYGTVLSNVWSRSPQYRQLIRDKTRRYAEGKNTASRPLISAAGAAGAGATNTTAGAISQERRKLETRLRMARSAGGLGERRQAVDEAVKHLRAQDPDERQYLAKALSEMEKEDFTEDAVSLVNETLRGSRSLGAGDALLAGMLGLNGLRPGLRVSMQKWVALHRAWKEQDGEEGPGYITRTFAPDWCAVLACARMGDADAVDLAMGLISDPAVSDQHRVGCDLFRAAAYIRDPRAVEFLRGKLNSKEMVQQVDPLWLWPAAALSLCVADFPVKSGDIAEIGANESRIWDFVNSHKGPWRIKGQTNPPPAKGSPVPVPGTHATGPPTPQSSGSITNGAGVR